MNIVSLAVRVLDRFRCLRNLNAPEEAGYFFEGALGGGEADALQAASAEMLEALQREGEMGAAFGGAEGVDLIDDDGLHR
ncbi:MAG: hypothetical protein WA802_06375, partial [Terracidiphilus sp.]